MADDLITRRISQLSAGADLEPSDQFAYQRGDAPAQRQTLQGVLDFLEAHGAGGIAAGVATQAADEATAARDGAEAAAALLNIKQMMQDHWLRAWTDQDSNLLGGWLRDGRFLAALSEDAVVPLASLAAEAQARMLSGTTAEQLSSFGQWLRVWTDQDRNLLGGWRRNGKFLADFDPACRFPAGIGLPPGLKVNSGADICCSGDSMTAGAGGNGVTMPNELAVLTGRTVRNLGVGGETSRTIAGRLGARPIMVTIPSGSIPASGGVTVTLAADDGGAVAPLLQGSSSQINPCVVAGVTGTLSLSAGVYTFTRSDPGSAVQVRRPAPLIPPNRNRLGDILILWWGQNDGFNEANAPGIIARQKATLEAAPVIRRRYLVVGAPSGTDASQANADALFIQAFGRRYVNIRKILSSAASFDEAGLTPTSDDLTAIAAGSVPPSLRSDAIHFNAAGYRLTAQHINARLIELGDLEV